jgi:hypothetical protein
MRDGRRVRIVPGAGAMMTQSTDMSDCLCSNREGIRALTVKMKKYELCEGGRGWGGAEIANEFGQSLEFCCLYRRCTH